jgi:hypothetical protein
MGAHRNNDEALSLDDMCREVARATPKDLADHVEDGTFQELATQLIKAFLIKRESGIDLPFASNQVTATESSVAASSIMDSAGLEFFEVTLWNSWGRV